MGFVSDAVEAEARGHHFSIRASVTLTGARCSLYVDEKKVDVGHATNFRGPEMLTAIVDGELVRAAVTMKLTGTRYRLFLGDEELVLRVERGEWALFVELRTPLQLRSGLPALPAGKETKGLRMPKSIESSV